MRTDLSTTAFGTQNKKPIAEFVYILSSQLVNSFIVV